MAACRDASLATASDPSFPNHQISSSYLQADASTLRRIRGKVWAQKSQSLHRIRHHILVFLPFCIPTVCTESEMSFCDHKFLSISRTPLLACDDDKLGTKQMKQVFIRWCFTVVVWWWWTGNTPISFISFLLSFYMCVDRDNAATKVGDSAYTKSFEG